MRLKNLELHGFKSFAGRTVLEFKHPIVAVVGPHGSGKSNVVEAFRFVLGEQSMKSMRGKAGADLIFKGSKSLSRSPKAGVTVSLDNADRVFKLTVEEGNDINLNFDTISISREVYPDGESIYSLNGTEVRLKDIVNLLASLNIGSSGHHIISQGEADRILSANLKERREMVEDALGLKIYRYKVRDSERKLERAEENMKEVSLLRRENAPHLAFLRKQMEKYERAEELRKELRALYRGYLADEWRYLTKAKSDLGKEQERIERELGEISKKHREEKEEVDGENKKLDALKPLEQRAARLVAERAEIERKLGRLEGIIEIKESKVKFSDICPVCGSKILSTSPEQEEKRKVEEKELVEARASQDAAQKDKERIDREHSLAQEEIENLRNEINKEISSLRSKEQEKYALKLRQQELSSSLEVLKVRGGSLAKEAEAFRTEILEGEALIGAAVHEYKKADESEGTDRVGQEERRRKIERIKIKLEESGESGGADIQKEFQALSDRDAFLERELADLKKSAESLVGLIAELKEKIDTEFKRGVDKINVEFKEFFALMFGGGSARLGVVAPVKRKNEELEEEAGETEEIEEPEEGIEINVNLPQKKVKELAALSGGERSLVSIALLFAMSQVNPPPFLVLDETDAALDESNSRKFGDMLEKLSKESQLVLVTHNRETMTRAGVLYGVTIGTDGASKLLSVKLAEAEAIAE